MAGSTAVSAQRERAAVYQVSVDVDQSGTFHYSLRVNNPGAEPEICATTELRPHVGKSISWDVRLMGDPLPFQIEFDGRGPFGNGNSVIRSRSGPTEPKVVKMPAGYRGNLYLKYRVTLANGWSDDPDVVPIVCDGLMKTESVIPVTVVKGALTVPSPATVTAGAAIWRWASPMADKLTLKFLNPPKAWPSAQVGPSQAIFLKLNAGSADYVISSLGQAVKASIAVQLLELG